MHRVCMSHLQTAKRHQWKQRNEPSVTVVCYLDKSASVKYSILALLLIKYRTAAILSTTPVLYKSSTEKVDQMALCPACCSCCWRRRRLGNTVSSKKIKIKNRNFATLCIVSHLHIRKQEDWTDGAMSLSLLMLPVERSVRDMLSCHRYEKNYCFTATIWITPNKREFRADGATSCLLSVWLPGNLYLVTN